MTRRGDRPAWSYEATRRLAEGEPIEAVASALGVTSPAVRWACSGDPIQEKAKLRAPARNAGSAGLREAPLRRGASKTQSGISGNIFSRVHGATSARRQYELK
jgi:hypothetical protein